MSLVDQTLGAVLIGFAVSCCVYGVLCTQMFTYFRNYPGDKLHLKFTVLTILVLETVDQAFIGHIIYFYSISNFGNPVALEKGTMTWSFIMQLTLGAVVGAIVKAYFGIRVWRFSNRNIWITGLILILCGGQLGVAFAFAVKAFQLPSVYAVHELKTLGTVALGVGVLTDVLTAAALCFFLTRLRIGVYSPESHSLIQSLCNYAINTGVLTSTVSIAVLVLYNASPASNLYFIATYFLLSKLYAISFMATLNTRRIVRGRGTDRNGSSHQNNNTNMFHLGTRMPSMAPRDLEQWDLVDPPLTSQIQYQKSQHVSRDEHTNSSDTYEHAKFRAL